MNVHELIDEAERHVFSEGARFGTRYQAEGVVGTGSGTLSVAVAVRIDHRGRRREQYFCDGTRVPRPVLLRLTCAEAECPQARAVREQWLQFHRRNEPRRTARVVDPGARTMLLTEVDVVAAGQRCVARSARFRCFTRCPNRAHPPLWIEKSGFDLFEDGVCVGGGTSTSGGTRQPRLPTIEAARAYLLSRQMEAQAVSQRAAKGSWRSGVGG